MLSRRNSLKTVVGGLGAVLLPARGLAAGPSRTNALETYLRVRSRLDGRPVFYPYRGTIFGRVIGQSAVRLFDVEGVSWDRLSRTDGGHYRIDTAEAGYFLDLRSGEPLSHWTNPLNGLNTEVKNYRSFSHVLLSEGKIEPIFATSMSGAEVTATMTPETTLGDRVWVHEDIIARYPNKPRSSFADPREYVGATLEAASLATWCAEARDLAASDRAFVPATLSYQTIGSWRPFMRMGETPGVISWRMFGTKMPSFNQVSAPLRERALSDYPDFLTRLG